MLPAIAPRLSTHSDIDILANALHGTAKQGGKKGDYEQEQLPIAGLGCVLEVGVHHDDSQTDPHA
jgi:hypothetical protein